jgi:hypothetical protein
LTDKSAVKKVRACALAANGARKCRAVAALARTGFGASDAAHAAVDAESMQPVERQQLRSGHVAAIRPRRHALPQKPATR